MSDLEAAVAAHLAEDAAGDAGDAERISTLQAALDAALADDAADEATIAELRAQVAALTPKPTLFGFWAGSVGVTGARASYDKVAAAIGEPGVYRMFYSGSPGTRFTGSNADFGPPVVVSFKFKPQDVVTGKHDATISAWFKSIPAERQVWWSYFHEPENDIEAGAFTADQYRAAWDHLLTLAPKRETLVATLILMRYSLDIPSKRTIANYVSEGLKAHGAGVLAWDTYRTSDTLTIKRLVADPADVSASFGLGFAIAETAAKDPTKAAAFVAELKPAAKAAGAQFVTWFYTNKAGQSVNEADWRMPADAVPGWRS